MNKWMTGLMLILNLTAALLLEAATPTPTPTPTPVPLEQIPIAWHTNIILVGALILVIIILAGTAWNMKQQR